jgi:polyisoprenoid-binding protein YceI
MKFKQERMSQFPRKHAIAVLLVVLGICGASATGAENLRASPPAPGSLEFVGRHLLSTANGRFREWRVVESQFALDALDESYAIVEVSLGSLDTGNDRRDQHLRTADFFEIEKYPIATARVHSLTPVGETEAGNPLFAAEFDLDLHGVKKTLSGEIELVSTQPAVFTGRLTMNRLDFEVGPPENLWNPMSVRAEISVNFRVEF